jgi:hypothetical protein
MRIETAECQIALPFNGSVKALLTWQASPLVPEGYCWLNCAKELEPFDRGNIYEIIIREKTGEK